MEYRIFGRTGWKISEIGYGMWGMAGWTGSDDKETETSLNIAVDKGCNFFDTAWGYGAGQSEKILGKLIRKHSAKKLYAATKIPPQNFKWPSKKDYKLADCFPEDHIIKYTEMSLKNLGLETIDLMQFHVWEDAWAGDDRWKNAVEKLKKEGKIQAMGVSVNRWEPVNCIETLKTGLIDSVQVIYNIFDQAPEDELFPLTEKLNIGIIARVPFDEGTLTGKLTKETVFPKDDWRSTYFVTENLNSSVDQADRLKTLIPKGMSMSEMALRFILSNKNVGTTIPGMRKPEHATANLAASDGKGLAKELLSQLKAHRWDREPTSWSQ
jgi:aryl-alcohol dehydrogenase-like predicted oxidoreductase